MSLTTSQREAFDRDGCVLVRSAVATEGVVRVLEAVDRLQATPSEHEAPVAVSLRCLGASATWVHSPFLLPDLIRP